MSNLQKCERIIQRTPETHCSDSLIFNIVPCLLRWFFYLHFFSELFESSLHLSCSVSPQCQSLFPKNEDVGSIDLIVLPLMQ